MNHVIQVLLHRLFVLCKLAFRALNILALKSQPVELLADFIGLLLRFLSLSLVFGNDLRELLVGSLQVLVLRLERLVFLYQSTDEFLKRSFASEKELTSMYWRVRLVSPCWPNCLEWMSSTISRPC